MREFFQAGPVLGNQYHGDRLLRSILKRKLTDAHFRQVENDLTRFGDRVVGDIAEWASQAEANPPRHVPFDPWGRRIDRIETASAWKELDRVSAEEGIVATGYERRYGALSRLVQFAKLYLFHSSSAYYSCPLAMTDGAARAIEVHGDSELKERAFRRLTSRDPSQFWTSGQWMTERTGGSDVSATSTVARFENGGFKLYGDKWFTSATTSQMAMTLARLENAPPGSKGLSLFYLELRDPNDQAGREPCREYNGALQGIRIHRLKDKLGTKALPTAELALEGTPARLVGGEGDGVKKIATLFNVTRVYNACCALSSMRRALALARDYAFRRVAFGKPLSEHPLHQATLAEMQVELEGSFHLVMHVAELLGKEETGQASREESAALRGLLPVAKLFTAKRGVWLASEALEAFGGAGYCEDTGIPKLLRDAQVLSIWEGTTNVLSLDLLRAIEKEQASVAIFTAARMRLAQITHAELILSRDFAAAALQSLEDFRIDLTQARGFAFATARVVIASLLLEHAQWALQNGESHLSVEAARRWCLQDLMMGFQVSAPSHVELSEKNRLLALDLK